MNTPLLPRFQSPRFHGRAGSTLAATMLVVLALITFLSISALITSQFGRFAGRQQGNYELMAAADAGLEYAYAAWADAQRKTTTAVVNYGNLNSTSLPFNAARVVFNTTVQPIQPADQNGIAVAVPVGTNTSNVPGYPGWSGKAFNYLATVQVTYAPTNYHFGFTAGSIPTVTVQRVFQYTKVPLFQAAIFYENTLEIHPGADMTVSGLVHTNADLWARGFSNLQFKSDVSYVSSYNETGNSAIKYGWDGYDYGWIPGVGPFAGVPPVTWSDGLTTGNSAAKATQLNQVSPIDPFGGASTSNNGLHDIIAVPNGSTPPTLATSAIAYDNAAAVIVINSSLPVGAPGRLTITNNLGLPLNPVDASNLAAAVNNALTTSIYDQREQQNVVVTNLDMTKLATATVAAVGKPPTPLQATFLATGLAAGTGPSGTIYIHDISPVTATEPAIRLINGANLGQNVTIASDNGVYIQGDYNTGVGTASNPVASNVSNPTGTTAPQINGYTRYASAVEADAVTILSNNWSDTNASQALSQRNATPTTVNTAILAGDVASDLNGNLTASGGAHNFPRFLENWNNVNFTYTGSLVEAYHSTEFTGLWQTGNVYYWPNRMWNFDTNFVNNPPPGTASGIQFSRGRWQRL